MDAEHREIEQRLGDEVAIAHRVHRVREGFVKAEQLGGERRIDGERRSGERSRTQRRDVHACSRGTQSVHVAQQRPRVGVQVVAQHHRLCALEMRVARQVRVGELLSHLNECLDHVERRRRDAVQRVTGIEAKGRRHLVVAAARRVHLRADVAGQFSRASFDRHVDVLVGVGTNEGPPIELGLDLIKGFEEQLTLLRAQQSGFGQTLDVRLGAQDVVMVEHVVERVTLRKLPERIRHRRREPTAPERHELVGVAFFAPWRAAQVFTPRP